MLENFSYAQLYSEIYPDYINNDTIITIPSQKLNQHFINTEIKGKLLGIQKTKKMSFKFYPFMNNDFISIPCSDTQFTFYVQFPINIMQSLTVKMSPSIKEFISLQKNNGIKAIATLDIALIENENEMPDKENFYLYPNFDIDFKLTNEREDAHSDIYRFFINNVEVLALSDSTSNSYSYNDFSSVLPLFTLNENNIKNQYDKEYYKYLNKNPKNESMPITILDSSICKGIYKEKDTQHLVVEKVEDFHPTGLYFDIQYKPNNKKQKISIDKFLNKAIDINNFFVNKEVIVTQGKSFYNQNNYNVLIVSEEIIAYTPI